MDFPARVWYDEDKVKGARPLYVRHAVRFFVRLCRKLAGILPYDKRFLCKMAENMQVYGI